MRYLILGGGITALSAAWKIRQKNPKASITILEKTNRLGGWIETSNQGGFLFEKGPRTFAFSRSPFLLKLIEELDLKIIHSDPKAAKRFLYYKDTLRPLSFFLPKLIPIFFREIFCKSLKEDREESIYEFASRRFNTKIAEQFFDPVTLGIYAGDIKKLSMRACFPTLVDWEKKYGSIVLGFWKNRKKPRGLFTLQGGMQKLVDALEKNIHAEIHFQCPVQEIKENEVIAKDQIYRADHIINALPLKTSHRSIWLVQVGYNRSVYLKRGFGYLVPTKERLSILGAVFDSMIFPEKDGKTKICFFIREEEKEPIKAALSALKKHLKIFSSPDFISSFFAKEAIAQFEKGSTPLFGISVDQCVQRGFFLAEKALRDC